MVEVDGQTPTTDTSPISLALRSLQRDIRVRPLTTNGCASAPLCSISVSPGWMQDEAVKQTNPDFDALLVFLANWEAIERSALGRILTAGQLADVQELERLYALPSGNPDDSSN
jgi:hypothetical protein